MKCWFHIFISNDEPPGQILFARGVIESDFWGFDVACFFLICLCLAASHFLSHFGPFGAYATSI